MERGRTPIRGASERPVAAYVLVASLAFQGLSGLAGGFGLTLDPSGASVGIPGEWLAGSPFPDYRVPGLVLFVVLGIGPLVAAFGVWARRSWAWMASLATGAALLIWLAVEVAVIGYQAEPPLQLVYGIVGGVILLTALMPAVRHHLRPGEG